MHFNPAGDTRLAAPIRCTAALLAGESQNVGKLFFLQTSVTTYQHGKPQQNALKVFIVKTARKVFCPQLIQ